MSMNSVQPDSSPSEEHTKSNHRYGAGASQILRRGLGLFWVLAGILQFQPLMFTPDFYAWYPSSIMESTIQTAADDQPHFVAELVHFGSNVWSTQPIMLNVAAATLQLVIGLLLIFGKGRIRQLTLWVSVGWGLLVWVIAEAFGDVFGGTTYFDGFPGAAALYVVSAALLLISGVVGNSESWLRNALRYIVTVYWFAVAYFQIIPSSGFWDPSGLMEPFANEAAQPGPALLARPVEWFSSVIQTQAGIINAVIILFMVLIAFLTLFDVWYTLTIILASAWFLWSWWFGQGFGAVFTGAGTDVNSIPIVGLWTICLWTTHRRRTSSL